MFVCRPAGFCGPLACGTRVLLVLVLVLVLVLLPRRQTKGRLSLAPTVEHSSKLALAPTNPSQPHSTNQPFPQDRASDLVLSQAHRRSDIIVVTRHPRQFCPSPPC